MNFPDNLKYTKEHEWLRIDGDIAVVGITEFAQSELGDVVYVDVNTIDDEINKDEVFGTVEAVKTVSDLFMPLTGKVLEFNTELDAQPELVRTMSVQPPRGKGSIRLLEIEGVDLQPCGGTHLRSTAEVGKVRVGKVEKKGKRNRRVNIHLDD